MAEIISAANYPMDVEQLSFSHKLNRLQNRHCPQQQVATCLGVQDFSQLRKGYGKEQADVIMNITGNIVSGQVTGDTSKQLSGRFGKIMQDRESLSINSQDTSISRSKQLEAAIPPSKVSALFFGRICRYGGR